MSPTGPAPRTTPACAVPEAAARAQIPVQRTRRRATALRDASSIGGGALLLLGGLWLVMIHAAGLQLGIRNRAHEPYSTTWIGWTGAVGAACGLALVIRGLRARRRLRADEEAARAARHERQRAAPGTGDGPPG